MPGHTPPSMGREMSDTCPSPPIQSSASAIPAARPPVASMPASITRAPLDNLCTPMRSTAACAPAGWVRGIDVFAKTPEPSIHVRRDRELLGRDPAGHAAERHRSDDGTDRRAKTSGVHELARAQSVRIRAAGGYPPAGDDR